MVPFKKAGIFISTAALSVGLLAPMASASTIGNDRVENLPIIVAQADTKVTKNDLIKRFNELFPNEFTNLTAKDFHMETGYYYPKDSKVRYELYFSKNIDNQYIHGSVLFVGDKLDVEYFYYQPIYTKDVLFPAKYSKDEAQEIANQFMKKLNKNEEYELIPSEYNYFSSSLLTDPIQYYFTYAKKKSGVPIADQNISISVLGDGTVTNYSKSEIEANKFTYDEIASAQKEDVIVQNIQDALKAQLSYKIDTDYRTSKHTVKLVYQPNSAGLTTIHAKTGQWMTMDGLASALPEYTIQPISSTPLPAKQPNLTEEQAKAMAEKLLTPTKPGVQLRIENVEETITETGKEVYEIQYMYEYEHGGAGTTLTIDKATGEIISYHDMSYYLDMTEEEHEPKIVLSQKQALEKAESLIKEWVPSYANRYAFPSITENFYEEYSNSYYIVFPRIVNGLTVSGDQIMINVDAETGNLLSLYVNAYDHIDWPSTTDILSLEEATKQLQDELTLKLKYVNHPKLDNEQHYSLAYEPVFKDGSSIGLDAKTGQWLNIFGTNVLDTPTIEHPTAAEELNYLIQTGALEVDDTFNPDAPVTKEDALKVLLNSLTFMYYDFEEEDGASHSFTDISPEDDLYPYVSKALRIGLLDKSSTKFNADAALSNQELAKWSIGMLKLDKAAQFSEIYKLNYRDAAQVDKDLRGHVALAYAMGLLESTNKQLKPKGEVTYAQLAQVTIRIAHKMNEYQIDHYY